MKSGKSRYEKPLFRLQGGLYYVLHPLYIKTERPPGMSHVFAVYSRHDLNAMLTAAKWWMEKDPQGCISDAMIFRYAAFWRFEDRENVKASVWHGDLKLIAKHPDFHVRRPKSIDLAFLKTADKKVKFSKEKVAEMIAAGYCRVSNKFLNLSRIDRPDWQWELAVRHAPWDPTGDGMQWANSSRMGDHYRRCYSKDVISLPSDCREIFNMFPGSGEGPDQYTALTTKFD